MLEGVQRGDSGAALRGLSAARTWGSTAVSSFTCSGRVRLAAAAVAGINAGVGQMSASLLEGRGELESDEGHCEGAQCAGSMANNLLYVSDEFVR